MRLDRSNKNYIRNISYFQILELPQVNPQCNCTSVKTQGRPDRGCCRRQKKKLRCLSCATLQVILLTLPISSFCLCLFQSLASQKLAITFIEKSILSHVLLNFAMISFDINYQDFFMTFALRIERNEQSFHVAFQTRKVVLLNLLSCWFNRDYHGRLPLSLLYFNHWHS